MYDDEAGGVIAAVGIENSVVVVATVGDVVATAAGAGAGLEFGKALPAPAIGCEAGKTVGAGAAANVAELTVGETANHAGVGLTGAADVNVGDV